MIRILSEKPSCITIADLPGIQVRQMTADDEPEFRDLLWAVYGESYSYRSLYAPGGYAQFVDSYQTICLGQFDANERLLGHMAIFFKDPKGDYAELGLTMRRFGRSNVAGRLSRINIRVQGEADARTCEWLSKTTGMAAAYLHQNTTTYHPLAQRHAAQKMRAIPTGIVVDFALGEQLNGIEHPRCPMQALAQTAVLRELEPRPVQIPTSRWFHWLADRFERLDRTPGRARGWLGPWTLKDIENNPNVDLRRRAVKRGPQCFPKIGPTRTDLLHVPCNGREIEPLLQMGYLPVGVRPHVSRDDEIVLQHLPIARRRAAIESLELACLWTPESKAMVAEWIALCKETL